MKRVTWKEYSAVLVGEVLGFLIWIGIMQIVRLF